MTQEALKLVLPLLEDCVNSYGLKYERPAFVKAITAIKEALAQPEQEPVVTKNEKGLTLHVGWDDLPAGTHLFTSPPQRTWVGLTDVEIEQAIELISMLHGDYATEVAYAIEAKLKEKNT
jgi:hypothetical protein